MSIHAPTNIDPKPPLIVVAEDDADIRELVVDLLRQEGHAVEWHDCGAGLLGRLGRQPDPTLVVTDLRLPRLDGLEVLERAAAMGVHVPALLFTAYGRDAEVRERARQLDVPVLPKPVAPSVLRAEVESLLSEQDFWAAPEHDGYSEIRPRAVRLPF